MNTTSLIGRTLHHFMIEEELGRGGMAIVYRAHQKNLNRMVALKVLPPERTIDESYVARFEQEARSAAGLEHSHIVPIYEVGSAEGYHYIVMKYIQGHTLKETITNEAPLNIQRIYDLLVPVGNALDYAHARGVIHRDIKPSNVMISKDGWVYLADFGLARANTEGMAAGLTQAGTIMGTPEYMSPEQAQGVVVGPASDIYSLAIMAYEMLSGKTPFTGDNSQAILFARVMHNPVPLSKHLPGIAPSVEDVLMQALARDPEARFKTAGVFLNALRTAGQQMTSESHRTIMVAPAQQGSQPSYPPPYMRQDQQQLGSQPNYPPPYMRQDQQQPVNYGYQQVNAIPQHAQIYSQEPTVALTKQKTKKPLFIVLGVGIAGILVVLFILFGQGNSVADLTAAGSAFDQVGNLPQAATLYAQAAKEHPKDEQAHIGYATTLLMLGKTIDAENAAQKAVNTNPESSTAHAIYSLALQTKSDYKRGITQAEEAVRLDDKNPLAYAALAMSYAEDANANLDPILLEQARKDAEQAIDLAEDNEDNFALAMAHNSLAYVDWLDFNTQLNLNQNPSSDLLDSAITELEYAIDYQAQLPELYTNLGYLYTLKGINVDTPFYKDAEVAFDKAITLEETYSNAYNGKGWLIYNRDNNPELALHQFEKAVEKNQQDPEALNGRGFMLRVLGDQGISADPREDYQSAEANFKLAIKFAPYNTSGYINLGYLYLYQLNDPNKAEDIFRQAVEKNPRYAKAYVGIGDALANTGYYLEAIEQYDLAIGYNPLFADAYIAKAESYESLKDIQSAITALEQGLTENLSQYDIDRIETYLKELK